jgi:hypothetical protein
VIAPRSAQILDELHWLRLLILREVLRFRAQRRGPDGLHGLYIGDEDVDRLLSEAIRYPGGPIAAGDADAAARLDLEAAAVRAAIGHAAREAAAAGAELALDRMARLFGLGDVDRAILVVACAPDLDDRFESLYAYLQDDIGRRRPSIGLVHRLLAPALEDRWLLRDRLHPRAPLVDGALVRVDGEGPYLGRTVAAEDRVVDELVSDEPRTDRRLAPFARLIRDELAWDDVRVPVATRADLAALGGLWGALGRHRDGIEPAPPVLVLEGGRGADTHVAAGALATALGRPRLAVRIEGLLRADLPARDAAALLRREALLTGALLTLEDAHLLAAEGPPRDLLPALEPLLREPPVPVVATALEPWDARRSLPGLRLLRQRFPPTPYDGRLGAWRQALDRHGLDAPAADVERLATTFVLTPGQIDAAAATAADAARAAPDERRGDGSQRLREAARAHSQHGLGALARKIEPVAGWEDIVLPPATMRQLREVAAAVRHRPTVLERWGFAARMNRGRGLNVLFSGPSGTGKTMAAEVLSGEVGLDLYAIDLATVVSKYIGETEKNLQRVFVEAQCSNAILFFDEADALFGRRSEVRDAHDRYANIEVAYLLQEMEAYEGMAILATNLSANLDESFARRMHHVLEFPLPDVALRTRLWAGAFPASVPLGADIDVPFLADSFELTGGSIQAAALHAALAAAADGGSVEMRHVLVGVAREHQKLGRLPSQGDFGPWYRVLLDQLGPVS